ncbi:hypothetical protein [Kribbia dieselivorans]|uniref:hypothetical protein n=1 Tax=Kribbia dieselivorans TaxID=331526 RepID=UPI0008388F2A|nr:hypothetical protein [Kribbia dieselivorans]
MTADPRAALNTFIAALERHFEASVGRNGEEDPRVLAAYEEVADAFEIYDDALFEAYGESTPLDIFTEDGEDDDLDLSDDDDDDDLDLDDEDDDTQTYGGLDAEDYDDEDVEGDDGEESGDAAR